MKENILILGFVLGGLFLIIWGAIGKQHDLILLGLSQFVTAGAYIKGQQSGEVKAFKSLLKQYGNNLEEK